MPEMDTKQVSVVLLRLEKKVDRLEDTLVSRIEVQSLREDLRELQDSYKWLTRTAVGALMLAILDPLLSLLGAG